MFAGDTPLDLALRSFVARQQRFTAHTNRTNHKFFDEPNKCRNGLGGLGVVSSFHAVFSSFVYCIALLLLLFETIFPFP